MVNFATRFKCSSKVECTVKRSVNIVVHVNPDNLIEPIIRGQIDVMLHALRYVV